MARGRRTFMHHAGPTLRPGPKFKFAHSSVPMRKPRRTRQHYGRGGGLRT